ncbi:MAG: SPASM domain-containing protein [Phycisphaerales bacterium JB063]
MTAITTTLDRRLAQTVAVTERWKLRNAHRPITARAARAADFLARGTFWAWRNRRYLTARKLGNMALVNVEFLLKRERLLGRPYAMKIESTNICNTECQLCPTGMGLRDRRKGRMKIEQFKSLVDELRWHLFSLDLSMWGDPLIAPDIYPMIRYAHDKGVWTYISSNLHGFHINPRKRKDGTTDERDDATKLIESGLDMLTCSLHGASQETFAIYQPGKNFGDAVEKVRHIVETKKRLKSSTPVIQLNFVVTRHNEHEVERFRAFAEEIGCKPVFSTASMNLRFLDKDQRLQPLGLAPDLLEKKTQEHLAEWLPENDEYVLDAYRDIQRDGIGHSQEYNGKKRYNCSWPWRQSVINWDGTVATCCGSFEKSEDLGDVTEQPFKKVWNSTPYRMARRSFKKKLSADQGQTNPCTECPGFML